MIKSNEFFLTQDSAPARRRRWSCVLGFLALITCPCHVPLLALALSGTAAGALLAAHFDKAVMLFSALFLLFAAIRVWRGKRIDGPLHEATNSFDRAPRTGP